MGMSAITFFGGAKGADAFVRRIEDVLRRRHQRRQPFHHGRARGLRRRQAHRRAVPLLAGHERGRDRLLLRDGLQRRARHRAAVHILDGDRRGDAGAVPRRTCSSLDGDDVDALVQVGTNLTMVQARRCRRAVARKPVVAINTATYWHALRANDIHDASRALAGCSRNGNTRAGSLQIESPAP